MNWETGELLIPIVPLYDGGARRDDVMKTRMVSIAIALLSFAFLSAVNVAIFRVLNASNRLESRNDGERTFNLLLSGLRDHRDFGATIESSDSLARKVVGVGVYDISGGALYTWGRAPPSLVAPITAKAHASESATTYIENAKNNSLLLLLRSSREGPMPPPPPEDKPDPNLGSGHSFLFGTLRKAEIILLEIRQPGFWQQRRLMTALLPTVEAVLAGLVISARMLILRNGEYRRRIDEQKNLVMLGTAASTLAHEIKNPLLAIRLQTGILARTLSGKGQREIDIIDDEVERLSRLSHKVNDILRDPAGIPALTDPVQIAREVGRRLCGRDIVSGSAGRGSAGADRSRAIALDTGKPCEKLAGKRRRRQ